MKHEIWKVLLFNYLDIYKKRVNCQPPTYIISASVGNGYFAHQQGSILCITSISFKIIEYLHIDQRSRWIRSWQGDDTLLWTLFYVPHYVSYIVSNRTSYTIAYNETLFLTLGNFIYTRK